MTEVEFECLNHIRAAMKDYLRWEWSITHPEFNHVCESMEGLEDVLWVFLRLNAIRLED